MNGVKLNESFAQTMQIWEGGVFALTESLWLMRSLQSRGGLWQRFNVVASSQEMKKNI